MRRYSTAKSSNASTRDRCTLAGSSAVRIFPRHVLRTDAGTPRDCRRDVERPAKMFSRMTKSDAQAVVLKQVVIERANVRQLVCERRRRFRIPVSSWRPI